MDEQRFELDFANPSSGLVRGDPVKDALPFLFEIGADLFDYDLKHRDDAGGSVAVIAIFQIGLSADGVFPHRAADGRFLPCLERRRLVGLLAFHRPTLRDYPSSTVTRCDNQNFEIFSTVLVTKAQGAVLAAERSGKEFVGRLRQLFEQMH